ncbi:MAG: hypothetical protein NZL87_08695, partial [Thermomicrobium sp.]|nr:hypothetical protein [Thermomicrobium sp.]
MSKSPPKDIGASERAWLSRLARERGENFPLVLTHCANERLFWLASSRTRVPETDLEYVGARYYDPRSTRWICTDPALAESFANGSVADPRNLHSYAFVFNSPANYVDRDGRQSVPSAGSAAQWVLETTPNAPFTMRQLATGVWTTVETITIVARAAPALASAPPALATGGSIVAGGVVAVGVAAVGVVGVGFLADRALGSLPNTVHMSEQDESGVRTDATAPVSPDHQSIDVTHRAQSPGGASGGSPDPGDNEPGNRGPDFNPFAWLSGLATTLTVNSQRLQSTARSGLDNLCRRSPLPNLGQRVVLRTGEGAAGGVSRITSGSQVTEQVIRDAMRGATLQSQQSGGVSLPRVQQYVDRLLAGDVAPAIKVDGPMIVDGNHRYIAGRILGR